MTDKISTKGEKYFMKLIKNALTILAIIIVLLVINTSTIKAKTLTVNTDTLKLRKEASTESTILELLNYGEKLQYIEDAGDWYKVKIRGITGYVHKDYVKVKEESTDTSTNNVVENTITNRDNTAITNTTNTIANNVENNTIGNTISEEENTVTVSSQPEITVLKEMKVSKDSNIYILPLINANIIQNVKKDSKISIIAKTNGWSYVETDEVTGWIRQDILVDINVTSSDTTTTNPNKDTDKQKNELETPSEIQITTKTMYVNTSSIYVRKGPGTENEVIDTLILNNKVKVVAENGDWYKVEVAGKTGYIAKRLLSDKQVNATSRGEVSREEEEIKDTENNTTSDNVVQKSKGEEIVEYAKKYLGCKYVYGGSGPDKFDCSGFTMYVLKNFGVTLSHSATAQSRVGAHVEKENLQLGDLVFFTDYETGKGIGHCGIYIGDGNFIHASSGTGYCVKISTLTSGSYLKRYETARRIVQ